MLNRVVDQDLELREKGEGGGGGGVVVLLALPAFLPSVSFSLFTQRNAGGVVLQTPPPDLPLEYPLSVQ